MSAERKKELCGINTSMDKFFAHIYVGDKGCMYLIFCRKIVESLESWVAERLHISLITLGQISCLLLME